MNAVFLDTVGLIASWNRSDQWHTPAVQAFAGILQQRRIPITTSYVLLECGNTVARTNLRVDLTRLRIALSQQGQLIDPTEGDLESAWDVFDRGKPGEAGIVDLISFAVMRRLGITQAFTNDRHFIAAGFETLFQPVQWGDQVEPRHEQNPKRSLDARDWDLQLVDKERGAQMNYWFDAFTGITWNEFRSAGAKVTGFRDHNWKRAEKIRPGDVFLCYMVGAKRWVGLLEVTGERYRDETPIWREEVFPVRFPVKPLVMLEAEYGVPMKDMEGKLKFFPVGGTKWSGWVRSSPTRYDVVDGDAIADALKEFQKAPVPRPVDPKLLERSSNLYKLKKGGARGTERIVSVPSDELEEDEAFVSPTTTTTHTEIQWRLLDLGSRMGLRVWAPKSDRGRAWNGAVINGIENLLEGLPTQFDDVTQRTIENIDVLWLSGNAIVGAFEVEHSTSIYSGLLRMSDLLTMQPNIDIKLYLVAPEERYTKFKNEVARATFAAPNKPLHEMCGFLPYRSLCDRLDQAKDFLPYLKPDFIDEITEFYDPAEEFDA